MKSNGKSRVMGFLSKVFGGRPVAATIGSSTTGARPEAIVLEVARYAQSFPVDLPEILRLSNSMLTGCGLQVVGVDNGADNCGATISYGAEPLQSAYGDGHQHYTGARVYGEILMKVGKSRKSAEFAGTYEPLQVIYTRHYAKAREAPFRDAFWASDFIESFSKLTSSFLGMDRAQSLVAVLRHEKARHVAFELLAELGRPAVEPLIAKLGDTDFRVRKGAADALTRIGWPAVRPLMELSNGADRLLVNTGKRILRQIEEGRRRS